MQLHCDFLAEGMIFQCLNCVPALSHEVLSSPVVRCSGAVSREKDSFVHSWVGVWMSMATGLLLLVRYSRREKFQTVLVDGYFSA